MNQIRNVSIATVLIFFILTIIIEIETMRPPRDYGQPLPVGSGENQTEPSAKQKPTLKPIQLNVSSIKEAFSPITNVFTTRKPLMQNINDRPNQSRTQLGQSSQSSGVEQNEYLDSSNDFE
ncbi:hypothetical protein SSS_10397 [Sarcoptes scabiei]|nr:hypothetical protein SSS_10397 [Sarcoptes scabiei]UXI20785.1 hypothetical protein NH340_JMT06728 [Sarcoptes scabiei]